MFFFSSRRRHTRCLSDWSSDVCSSDLSTPPPTSRGVEGETLACGSGAMSVAVWSVAGGGRSEERRVGKECRSRWSADHLKKNREGRRAGEDKRQYEFIKRIVERQE